MQKFVVTGTDTDVGKTVFSAALMMGLEDAGQNPHYWKPIQSGIVDSVDTRTVQQLTQLADERFCPEHYILSEPLSPHIAAEIDDVTIDIQALRSGVPECDGTLIIEGAGGMFVPLTRSHLQVNLYKKWGHPIILCARTSLGTINHTLLSLEAILERDLPLLGIVFIGEENADNMRTIADFSKAKVLGRLPMLDHLDDKALRLNFANHFDIQDFL